MNSTFRLTSKMMETLMQIYKKEVMGEDPFGQEAKYIAGLYRRGLVHVKPWVNEKGKYYMGFFLTDAGKEYLHKSAKTNKV